MNNSKMIINGLSVIIGIFLVVLVLSSEKTGPQPEVSRKSQPVSLTRNEELEEEKKWVGRIHEVGSKKAYDEFKQVYANVHFGTQHTMAHIVGAEIYEEAGIDGVSVCDNSFAFGCYHGYFSRALSEQGTAIVKLLDEACVAKFGVLGTGCQHGIGHGLMEYFGSVGITAALEACAPTTAQSELAGCVSGVFMEYNVPIIISEAGAATIPRQFDAENPYDPCPSLADKYQPSCYYEIAAWWNLTDNRGNYEQIGRLCEQVPNQSLKETCFMGVGNVVAPSANYDVKSSIANCKKMPHEEGIIACQAGASWSFDANPDFRNQAKYLCDELAAGSREQCIHRAHILNPENS